MKRLSTKIVLFGLLVFFVYVAFSMFVRYKVNEQIKIALNPRVRYLVIGNSHPECALNDSLAPMMSNWGRSGEALYYSAIKAKKIIDENPQLKAICIELSVNQLDAHMHEWVYDAEHMERAFKSYGFLISVREQQELFWTNPIEFCKASVLSDKKCVSSLMVKNDLSPKSLEWGGFQKHKISNVDSLLKLNTPCQGTLNLQPLVENIKAVEDLVQFAKMKGVEVVLIRCPVHSLAGRCWEQSFDSIRKEKFGTLRFFDFQEWQGEQEEYLDLEHLNTKGANKFTPYFDSVITAQLQLPLN
jgi:hypothetical protein